MCNISDRSPMYRPSIARPNSRPRYPGSCRKPEVVLLPFVHKFSMQVQPSFQTKFQLLLTCSTEQQASNFMRHLPLSHLSSLCVSLLIAVGERERTRALHGEILYPSTPFAASDPSAGASVGAPQVIPLSECSPPLFLFLSFLVFIYIICLYVHDNGCVREPSHLQNLCDFT